MYKKYTFKTPINQQPTFLSRFNPTLKVVCMIILLVLTFLKVNSIALISVFLILLGLWISAKLPFRKMKAILKTLAFIMFFVFLINWLVVKEPGLVVSSTYQYWGPNISSSFNKLIFNNNQYYWSSARVWGGWVSPVLTDIRPIAGKYMTAIIGGKEWFLPYTYSWYALSSRTLIVTISVGIKLWCMLTAFSLLVNTTSTLQLTYAFEHIFWPLKWIKVPVTELATIIAIAIRFVPNLFEEANRVIDAQAARGVDFRNGKLIAKLKAMVALFVPMFSIAFNKADQLSDAMEARRYEPRGKRTKYRKYSIRVIDWICFAGLLCMFALFIYFRVKRVIIYPFTALDIFLA